MWSGCWRPGVPERSPFPLTPDSAWINTFGWRGRLAGAALAAFLALSPSAAQEPTGPFLFINQERILTGSKTGQALLAQEDRELTRMLDAATIRKLLDTLPGRSRMILYLRFFEHMSQAEIAQHVGTSQVHVGRLLKAALEQLRSQLDPEQLSELV